MVKLVVNYPEAGDTVDIIVLDGEEAVSTQSLNKDMHGVELMAIGRDIAVTVAEGLGATVETTGEPCV